VKNVLNKKSIFVLFFMALSVMAINAQTNVGSAKTSKENALPSVVKIGFLYPATGALGPIGQGLLDGAMAAAYRINTTYSGFNVAVVKADTATDPSTAKTSAQSLVSDGVQVVVGAAASGATLAASEVTIPNNVPLISYASTSPSITALNDSDYVFRVVASDAYQGVALANLSYNSGAHNVYILNLDNAYGNGVAAKFKTAYTALGGTIAGQTAYDPASTSFSTEVSNVKSSGADGVVMVSYPTDANAIFAAAKAQTVNGPFFGTDGIASNSVTNNTGTRDFLNGKLFGTTPSTGANASQTLYTQFTADLATTGGSYGVYGDYVYDAFLLAAAAVNQSGTYSGQAIRDALYKVADGFKGATSPNKAFNCDGDPISQTYDFWNASNYEVTTQQSAAVAFMGLGTAATTPCNDHPYVATSTTATTTTSSASSGATSSTSQSSSSSVASPGFELLAVLGLMALVSVKAIGKRKQN
jgi:ABC-type branched-subunit amino acid transport system substrate-binding protein